MAEEHRCQSPPEGHRQCANNCGFFGSPATLNLCSKCYRDLHLTSPGLVASPPSPTPLSLKPSAAGQTLLPSSSVPHASPDPSPRTSSSAARCGACRKRVGLAGFRCRCGETYCGAHRHPEEHACGFDFKSAGKDAIARANPVVKAAKLGRI